MPCKYPVIKVRTIIEPGTVAEIPVFIEHIVYPKPGTAADQSRKHYSTLVTVSGSLPLVDQFEDVVAKIEAAAGTDITSTP